MKTNQEIIEEFERRWYSDWYPLPDEIHEIDDVNAFIVQALEAKDKACKEAMIELVESVEPCCSTCDMWQWKSEKLTQLKNV